MPDTFTKWLSLRSLSYGDRWASLEKRPDRAVTGADGCFRFIDLPDGSYTVEVTPKEGSRRYGAAVQSFAVARGQDGLINAVMAVIALPATAVRGTILASSGADEEEGATTAPLSMARAEVLGTSERVYSDASGSFYLTDVECGERQLEITASGYQARRTAVTVVRGEITEMGSFVLEPVSITI